MIVQAMQTPLYYVSNKIQWEKGYKHTNCKLEDMTGDKATVGKGKSKRVNTDCAEMFYFDVIEPFIASTERLESMRGQEQPGEYHIPAFFGDDFAYKDAAYNFKFI
jgi:hypothetical protein